MTSNCSSWNLGPANSDSSSVDHLNCYVLWCSGWRLKKMEEVRITDIRSLPIGLSNTATGDLNEQFCHKKKQGKHTTFSKCAKWTQIVSYLKEAEKGRSTADGRGANRGLHQMKCCDLSNLLQLPPKSWKCDILLLYKGYLPPARCSSGFSFILSRRWEKH